MEGEQADEKDDLIEQLVNQLNNQQGQNMGLNTSLNNMSLARQDPNLISVQIETDVLLEKLEHFYRGDVIGKDKQNNEIWVKQKNKELVTFNEFGVSSLMEIVTKYIDKNTSLSYYSEDRINEILGDLGDELILFLSCNDVKLGMDTPFKQTKFRLIIVTTLHIIESMYRRAIRGRTTEEINQSRIVTQTEGLGNRMMIPQKKGFMSRLFLGR